MFPIKTALPTSAEFAGPPWIYNRLRLAIAVRHCVEAHYEHELTDAANELAHAIDDVLQDLKERDHD